MNLWRFASQKAWDNPGFAAISKSFGSHPEVSPDPASKKIDITEHLLTPPFSLLQILKYYTLAETTIQADCGVHVANKLSDC